MNTKDLAFAVDSTLVAYYNGALTVEDALKAIVASVAEYLETENRIEAEQNAIEAE